MEKEKLQYLDGINACVNIFSKMLIAIEKETELLKIKQLIAFAAEELIALATKELKGEN